MDKISYQFLNDSYTDEIHKCFMHSFADYNIDMNYLTIDRMISRAKMNRVDYKLSVGAFKGSEMIGFLIVGTDKINKEHCAFDAGTGIIPEYRGRGIAGRLFDFVLPKLREMKINSFILEVLQDNSAAIKAYKKSNFEITRSFNCYKIDTELFSSETYNMPYITIKPLDKNSLIDYIQFNDWEVSWEYRLSAINSIQEDLIIYGAFTQNECVGFIVYYPTLEWIFMLSVKSEFRRKKIGSLLISTLINEVKAKTSEIKFNNLPPEHEICSFLEKNRFELYATQYEMIYSL